MVLSRVVVPVFPMEWGWMVSGMVGMVFGIAVGWWWRKRDDRPRPCAIATRLQQVQNWQVPTWQVPDWPVPDWQVPDWVQDAGYGSASYVLEQLATLSLPIIVTTGAEDRIVAANGPFEQLTGWTTAEIQGQTTADLGLWVDPSERDRLKTTLQSAQQCYNLRMRFGTSAGTSRVGLVSAEVLTHGRETSVVWSVEDITSQSQALNRLGLNQDRYRQTFENSPNPILTLGRDRTICHWNTVCESTFGYPITAVLGQPLQSLVVAMGPPSSWREDATQSTATAAPTAHAPALDAVVNAAFQGEVLSGITLTYRCADGSERYMLARFYPLFGEPGQPAAIAIANTDITDLKATQTALQVSQERYAIATAAARIGVWDFTPQSRVIYIDAALNHLLGYESVEMRFPLDRWLQRIHPDDRDHVHAVVEVSLANAQPTFEVEHRFVCANGQSLWFLARGRVLRDEWGQVVRVLGTSTDITQRKQAELALRHSETTTRALIAAIPDRFVCLRADGRFLDVNTGDPLATTLPLAESQSIRMDQPTSLAPTTGGDPGGDRPPTILTVHHVLTPTQAQGCLIQVQRALQQQAVQIYEYDYEQDGQRHTDEVRIAPLGSEQALAILRDVTVRKQQEQGLRQQLHLERSLLQAIQAIRSPLALEEVFPAAVDEMSLVLDIDRAEVVRLDEERDRWVHVADYRRDLSWPSALNVEFPHTANPFAVRLGQFEIVEVADFSQITDPVNIRLRNLFPGTWILVPIRVGDRLWGSLSLNRRDPNSVWKDVERDLAATIAQQLAIAIQQGELYQQLRNANHRLAQLATTDELTQVANRRSFDQMLRQEWRRMARARLPLSLIMLDIDYFKQYNDSYGHLAGDRCLAAVAQAIDQAANRPGDLVARYGGEEFAVILPETPLEAATYMAGRISAAIHALHLPHPRSPFGQISISLGVACTHPQGDPQPEPLIAAADAALYRAKASGRNAYQATTI